MNLPYYILISQRESIELTKNSKIDLPLLTRAIDDKGDQDKLITEITSKLINLNTNEDSDYLLLLIKAPKSNINIVTLKISDVSNQYCLTKDALTFYQTRINPHYNYKIITEILSGIDIENIIQKVQSNKIVELIEDKYVFNISIKDLPINPEEGYGELINFKRECLLIKNDLSYFNDLITIAILLKKPDLIDRYKAREDLAEQTKAWSAINSIDTVENNIKELLLQAVEIPEIIKLNVVLKNEFGSDIEGFSFVAFVLVYLKIFDVYQNSENKVRGLFDVFKDLLQTNQFQPEIKSAYYLFLRTCGYDNLYTDYYQFKKLKINTGSDEFSYSVLKNKLNEAKLQIESFSEITGELRTTQDQLPQIQSELDRVNLENSELRRTLDQLSQIQSELDRVNLENSELRRNQDQLPQIQSELDRVNLENSELRRNQDQLLQIQSELSRVNLENSELRRNQEQFPQIQSELDRVNRENSDLKSTQNQQSKIHQIDNSDFFKAENESSSIIIPIDKLKTLASSNLKALLRIEENPDKKLMIENFLENKK